MAAQRHVTYSQSVKDVKCMLADSDEEIAISSKAESRPTSRHSSTLIKYT